MLVATGRVEREAAELEQHVAGLQDAGGAAVRRHVGQAHAGLAGAQAEGRTQRRVREVLPGEAGAGEAPPVVLVRALEELLEHGRGERSDRCRRNGR